MLITSSTTVISKDFNRLLHIVFLSFQGWFDTIKDIISFKIRNLNTDSFSDGSNEIKSIDRDLKHKLYCTHVIYSHDIVALDNKSHNTK